MPQFFFPEATHFSHHDISQSSPWTHSHIQVNISITIFSHYHDILILSWHLKISSPYTLGHIQTNIWYHDIDIDINLLLTAEREDNWVNVLYNKLCEYTE